MKHKLLALFLSTSFLWAQEETAEEQTAFQVREIENAKVLSVSAFAHSTETMPGTDEKVIHIPEGWRYYSHVYWQKSRSGNFFVTPAWAVANPNDPSKMAEVHIKVSAFPETNGASWIQAELVVMIVPEVK